MTSPHGLAGLSAPSPAGPAPAGNLSPAVDPVEAPAAPRQASADLHDALLDWYARNARALPWREPGTSPWAVLVSEVMLQQTPVARVLPVWESWLRQWPTPAALAAEEAGSAIRAWGRLGYPRRALRLHAAAREIVAHHDGDVPADLVELRALPGVGEYTAAAVTAFAFGQRQVVLDTNVRRVLARMVSGAAQPPASVTAAERTLAEALLPGPPPSAAIWAVAVMELGALVCVSREPRCGACPVAGHCRWLGVGRPARDAPTRRHQGYAGTDRQCRGRLLGAVRDAEGAVPHPVLAALWEPVEQRERCLAGLLLDGLLVQDGAGYRLP